MPTILIAGGGTGGHVFPALAIARALQRHADVDVVFAGTPRGLEGRVIPAAGYALELLDVVPMKGGGPERAIRSALLAAQATRQARTIIGRLKPSAVLSVGGYAAGPASLAGVAHRVPLALLEPNSTLGLANRMLAPFAKRAYIAWPETGRQFKKDKTRLFGVPLRPGFEPQAYAPAPGAKRVLVLGGSQGAIALNEAVPKALLRVRKTVPLAIVHQSGKDREFAVREAYGTAEDVEVLPFIDDISEQMAKADLIISRSGAATVAEIAAIGRPALFIPFPYAADDHQAKNALSLAQIGGAVCLRQDEADDSRLWTEIASLLGDPARLVRMADAARAHGRPNAADDIAKDLLSLAGIGLKKRESPVGDREGQPMKTNGATNGSSSSHFKVDLGGDKEKSS